MAPPANAPKKNSSTDQPLARPATTASASEEMQPANQRSNYRCLTMPDSKNMCLYIITYHSVVVIQHVYIIAYTGTVTVCKNMASKRPILRKPEMLKGCRTNFPYDGLDPPAIGGTTSGPFLSWCPCPLLRGYSQESRNLYRVESLSDQNSKVNIYKQFWCFDQLVLIPGPRLLFLHGFTWVYHLRKKK